VSPRCASAGQGQRSSPREQLATEGSPTPEPPPDEVPEPDGDLVPSLDARGRKGATSDPMSGPIAGLRLLSRRAK
jgi:hypothetical protein